MRTGPRFTTPPPAPQAEAPTIVGASEGPIEIIAVPPSAFVADP